MIAYYAPNRQNENMELIKIPGFARSLGGARIYYRNEELYGRESDGDY